ncbi:hypothetical protein LCGC14_0770900 [marine sediment metagenome]|uniref:Uncharacterized protein n=1 Tax=marine sediment metagenome TaxID=412755 RepID=A0A0F9QI30_9ZZZZ
MKKVILLAFILIGLNVSGQDFKIDAPVKYANGIVSPSPNYIKLNSLFIKRQNDSTWSFEPQYFTEDSLGHRLLPNDDLIGSRSNGTVKVFTITSKEAGLHPDSLINLFWLPYLETIYPGKVAKDKPIFTKDK